MNQMKVGEYYEIAKESTSQDIKTLVQNTKETVENFHAGGVPPTNMAAAKVNVGDKKLELTFTEPADTVIDNQLICTVAGCMVRMKEGGYPADEKDGTLVVNNKEPGKYTTTPLEITGLTNNTTYYLAFFPYSDQGLFNYNKANRREATPRGYKLYGFKINKNDSNPATRITYTEMAENFTPAYMNFVTGTFNYGSWKDVWFLKNNKPYMVKNDGTLDYQLNPNDYTKKLDGTASDASNNSYSGNAMSYFPLVWFKRWEVGSYECVNVCNIRLDETYKAYAHTRADGSIMDYKLISMFEGSYDISGKMRSLSGQTVGASLTAAMEISYATANGSLWYTQSFSEWSMIADLLRLISRSDDAQTAFGFGIGGAQGVEATGTLNNKGQFFGYSAEQSTAKAVKVFHVENFWGNVWNRIAGIINMPRKIYTKAIPPYNETGSGYTDTNLVLGGINGGYVNRTRMTEHGRIPYYAEGSATTYTCDGLWFSEGQRDYALVGGRFNDNTRMGFSNMNFSISGYDKQTVINACLSCEQPAI